MYIILNEQNVPVNISLVGDRLSLSFSTSEHLVDIFQAFQPDNMPEITIYDETKGNITSAIYASYKVIELHAFEQGYVQVDLQVSPLEISKERELRELIMVQIQETFDNNEVIDEILAMLADHEARLKALEPNPDEGTIVIDDDIPPVEPPADGDNEGTTPAEDEETTPSEGNDEGGTEE